MINLILSPNGKTMTFFVYFFSPKLLANLTSFSATQYDCSKLRGLSSHQFWPRPLILTVFPVPHMKYIFVFFIWEIQKDWRTWPSFYPLVFAILSSLTIPHVFSLQVGVESMWYRNPDGFQKEAAQKSSDWQKMKKEKKQQQRKENTRCDTLPCVSSCSLSLGIALLWWIWVFFFMPSSEWLSTLSSSASFLVLNF